MTRRYVFFLFQAEDGIRAGTVTGVQTCALPIVIRGEGGYVDQPGDAVVGARGRDDGPAVRVADENGRAADPPQRTDYRSDVAFERVEAVLCGHHLVPVRLKRRDHF